ncbi:ParB N-terminal domain-containing protein [Methanoculleus sp.]|uniref:ParB/RepB/Spo0J family partition protein n=1 Tax=Methanoculleus sp. TaxID=90427 RepID=UPI0025FB518D|nr:ParB N-terminal domain-containing protein [Methanoculleus sp.]MCK9319452.1 ParB N-terminal domain-containing protein [Methanoculleus sp.]
MSDIDDITLDDLDLDLDDEVEVEPSENEPMDNPELELDDLDLDDMEDSNNPPVVDEVAEDLANLKGKPDNESLDDIDLDLELADDVNPDTSTQAPVVEVSKPTKPANDKKIKKIKETEVPVVETNSYIRFEPEFDISPKNLDTKKYQVRKTSRTVSEIEDLKNRIELQGQIEPIQIAVLNDKNYLIAGEGRVLALRQLDKPAKAIVYHGLSEEQILKISFGSNECRLEMSEWDKTVSIGRYFEKDTMVSKDDPTDPKSLVSIFGLNKSSIYNYLKIWNFYKEKEIFHDFFNKNRCPLYVVAGVAEVLDGYADKINSYKPVIDILKIIVNRNDLSKKTFTNALIKEITGFLLDVKMGTNAIEIDNIPFDDVELSNAETKTRKEIKEKFKLTEAEQIKKRLENNKSKQELAEKAEKLIKELDKNLEAGIMVLETLGNLDEFHNIVPSDIINSAVKNLSRLNQLITILV